MPEHRSWFAGCVVVWCSVLNWQAGGFWVLGFKQKNRLGHEAKPLSDFPLRWMQEAGVI